MDTVQSSDTLREKKTAEKITSCINALLVKIFRMCRKKKKKQNKLKAKTSEL